MFPFVRDRRDGDGPVEQTRVEDGRPEVERAPADPVQNGSVQPAGRQRVLGTGQHQGGGRCLWTTRGWWMFGPAVAFGLTTSVRRKRAVTAH